LCADHRFRSRHASTSATRVGTFLHSSSHCTSACFAVRGFVPPRFVGGYHRPDPPCCADATLSTSVQIGTAAVGKTTHDALSSIWTCDVASLDPKIESAKCQTTLRVSRRTFCLSLVSRECPRLSHKCRFQVASRIESKAQAWFTTNSYASESTFAVGRGCPVGMQ
jgi:hypothetical protein